MRPIPIFVFMFVMALFFACHSYKKGQTMATNATNGVPVPTQVQLGAIQPKYKNVTMEVLTSGHALYIGTCTKCHGAEPITKYAEGEWMKIIDRMARKAKLSEDEKDQVTKYVMSVKASQH